MVAPPSTETGNLFEVKVYPSGFRVFDFTMPSIGAGDGGQGPVLPFLYTDRAPQVLECIEKTDACLARQLLLAQVLFPCLGYRGNRRHFVREPWGLDEINGTNLNSGSQSSFRSDVSQKQADEFQDVMHGTKPPNGSLPETFWGAHVATPSVSDVFEDAEMGGMAKALLKRLVPDTRNRCDLDVDTNSIVAQLWKSNFGDLNISVKIRDRRRVFKRLISATIRLASQFHGLVVRTYVLELIGTGEYGPKELSSAEGDLLELMHGGCRCFADVNIGLFQGSGELFAGLVSEYAGALATSDTKEQHRIEQAMACNFSLLVSHRERRKTISAVERRERRQRHQDFLPAPRIQAEGQKDVRAKDPSVIAEGNPLYNIADRVMPNLKPRDQARFQALLDTDCDRGLAADKLGISRKRFNLRWRQTTLPNIHRIVKEMDLEELD